MEKIENKKSKKKGCLISFLVVLIVIVVFGIVLDKSTPKSDKNNTPKEYADLSSGVQVFAEKILVKQLKYPDGWEYDYNKLIRDDSTRYTFQAIVLANNAFGVRSRISYLLQMEFIGSKEQSRELKEYSKASNWKILRNEVSE